jgi:hypothetical protein
MILVNDRPTNGVDLSHWNADAPGLIDQDWLQFYAHKACHVGGKSMAEGVDPKFEARRKLGINLDIRWRAFYMWLVPTSTAGIAAQVELLLRTVGELQPGEAVYLDWEDKAVTRKMVDEFTIYMNLEYEGRWFMYANDSTPDMTAWMEFNTASRAVPLMHPNYSIEQGLTEARKWNATVWQTGLGTPPGFIGDVPLDYVLQPDQLDKVCGRPRR